MSESSLLMSCEHKLVFDTQKSAQAMATTLKHQKGTKLKPYKCEKCGLWHLTSSFDQ